MNKIYRKLRQKYKKTKRSKSKEKVLDAKDKEQLIDAVDDFLD